LVANSTVPRSFTRHLVDRPGGCRGIRNRLRGKMLQTEPYVACRLSVNADNEVINGGASRRRRAFDVDGRREPPRFL
jgi:hypothetical protein